MAEDAVDPDPTLEPDVSSAAVDEPAEVPDAAEAAPAAKASTPSTKATAATDATVVRKKVVSKRVTPKGTAQGAKVGSTPARTKASATEADEDFSYSKRYTPPAQQYAQGPSPWWVPAIMFGLLIVGALVIMLNYMSVFGDPANIRLVIGLAFILGGIVAATQYR